MNISDAFVKEPSPALDFDAAVLSQALPSYEILETLDRGGQGVVYRAIQRSTGRIVALKVLHADGGASGRRALRFAREVELVARLRHPHVVTIFDSGVAAGRPYLSMELIDGLSIDDYVLVNRPTVRECVILFEKICRAAASVHQRGVIHRDLKPSNIRVDLEGEPHILDFGLAKCAEDEAFEPSVSVEGQVVGTLPFLSPEQITGADGGVDIRTDIYALGVILHLLLTGDMPYPIEDSRQAVAGNIVGKVPGRLDRRDRERDESGAVGAISSDLSHVVLKALAKEKDRRYQSADAFADDLRRFLDGGAIVARGDGFGYLVRVAWRKYQVHSMVAAAFVMLLAGSAVSMGIMWQRSDRIARDATASLEMGRYCRLGSVARDEGRISDSIRMCEQIIEIFGRISFPSVDDFRAYYGAHHDLAQIYLPMKGKSPLCEKHFTAAHDIASSLVQQYPDEPEYRRLLAFECRLGGRLALRLEEWGRAESLFLKSSQLFDSLPREGSSVFDAAIDFEREFSRQYFARAQIKAGERQNALDVLASVRDKLIVICGLHPKSMDFLIELIRTESMMAGELLNEENLDKDNLASTILTSAQGRLKHAHATGMADSRQFETEQLEKTVNKNATIAEKRLRKARPMAN